MATDDNTGNTTPTFTNCQILWSTQSGRAKACARRTARILKERTTLQIQNAGSSFDEATEPFLSMVSNLPSNTFLLLFVSTTGDGEHCDSIRNTWKTLLQKSLQNNLFQEKQTPPFALYCLGDRAYGNQYCAAGRKLAVRLLHLGMTRFCEVGYGDDNTPNGGVFRDLDTWLENHLLPKLEPKMTNHNGLDTLSTFVQANPFRVEVLGDNDKTEDMALQVEEEWQNHRFCDDYRDYFTLSCPVTAYKYDDNTVKRVEKGFENQNLVLPLLGEVVSNERMTPVDWEQDTRHICIQLKQSSLPLSSSSSGGDDNENKNNNNDNALLSYYKAGDVAAVLPFNSHVEVDRFLAVLPETIQSMADSILEIHVDETLMNHNFTRWPETCTLRGWLQFCADIHSLPEREDLRALSYYCSEEHDLGKDQSEKLRSLSETSEAALYADYIIREKRSWADVFFDFESLRSVGSKLTLESLLMILPPMRPREFSIASAPSTATLFAKGMEHYEDDSTGFSIELCVAVVRGKTRRGRPFHGLCSEFLSRMLPSKSPQPGPPGPLLQVWIRPGTFGDLPLSLDENNAFDVPILCVAAGTGVAPMRSLLMERDAVRSMAVQTGSESGVTTNEYNENENILVFGCRKEKADYYYQDEWKNMRNQKRLRLLTAFSRDQVHKIYVQRVLREADEGSLIATHVLHRNGALYIAGGPQMARCVKEEVVEALAKELEGGEKQALKMLAKLQRAGLYSVEAWS